MTKVKKEIGSKWIAALRSGKFEQGKCVLNVGGKFCCLGVLCEVLELNKGRDSCNGYTSYVDLNGREMSVRLSTAMRILTGISDEEHSVLMDMNDNQDKTFLEIADYIEQKLLGEE